MSAVIRDQAFVLGFDLARSVADHAFRERLRAAGHVSGMPIVPLRPGESAVDGLARTGTPEPCMVAWRDGSDIKVKVVGGAA